jgi:hypothetical protein
MTGCRAAAAAREQLVLELLRVTEWRGKAGVGAFPYPDQTQDLPSKEVLQDYLNQLPE